MAPGAGPHTKKRKLGDQDILDILDEVLEDVYEDDDEEQAVADEKTAEELNVIFYPPDERPDADTDMDSDDEDKPSGSAKNLPSKLLKGKGELKKRKRRKKSGAVTETHLSDNEEPEPTAAPADSRKRVWSEQRSNKIGSEVPNFQKPIDPLLKFAGLQSAYEFYKVFQPKEFTDEIIELSIRYGKQKHYEKDVKVMNYDNLRCVEASMLLTGYHSVPQRKMIWQEKEDCRIGLIADNIRRNTFDSVLKCLHLCDNTQLDPNDKFFKVRKMFDNQNRGGAFFSSMTDSFSVDEMMLPYYGTNSSKQRMCKKPVTYGFKVWSLCTSYGEGVYHVPYCGAYTRISDFGLGQGPNVVLDLVVKSQILPGSCVYFDNLFTSFPLLDELSRRGIGGTGTVRQNRLGSANPIKKKKEADKLPRGSVESVYTEDKVLCVWKDSKPVYVASNKHDSIIHSQPVKRWDKAHKKELSVPIPEAVAAYNRGIGGVDLMDGMIAVYRSPTRIRKWWFPFYSWSLSASAVNAWRLRRRVLESKESYLEFLRELVVEMLKTHGSLAVRPRLQTTLLEPVRFDMLGHFISQNSKVDGKTKKRNCKHCFNLGKKDYKSSFHCEKCGVGLHRACFKDYHTKEETVFEKETVFKEETVYKEVTGFEVAMVLKEETVFEEETVHKEVTGFEEEMVFKEETVLKEETVYEELPLNEFVEPPQTFKWIV